MRWFHNYGCGLMLWLILLNQLATLTHTLVDIKLWPSQYLADEYSSNKYQRII